MSDATWGGRYAAHAQYSSTHGHYANAGARYVHPAHGGPMPPEPQAPYGAPPAYGAQSEYDPAAQHPVEGGHPPSGGGSLGRVLHGAGALLSIALIAGLGAWGYQLAMRDVNGVPVVRALEGPMRIQPDDPGGVAAAHQGLAVNAIAAEGQAEGPTPQVVLAPPPAALAAEDAPAQSGSAVSATSMAEAGEVVAPEDESAPSVQATSLDTGASDDGARAEALALAEAAAADAAPLSGEENDMTMTPEAEARLAVATIPASVPGVAASPRPAPRPDDIVARAAASPVEIALASASASAPNGVREIPAEEVPAGTRLVQLGAFDSAEVARAEWAKLANRFDEILVDKDRVIEKAQSGGKTFYRLRAMGFADLSDARRFCSALMAGQAACIPVVTR